MNIIEQLQRSAPEDVLATIALALADHHERCHPPRVALPEGYDPTGKSLNKVRRETGLSAHAIRRIFRRRGLSRQIQPSNAVKTHCKQGHEFTSDNTYQQPRGEGASRICRACTALRARTPERRKADRELKAKYRQCLAYQAHMKAYLREYRKTYVLRPGVRERKALLQRLRRARALTLDIAV